MELKELLAHWVSIKEQEKAMTDWRRDIEDQLISRLKLENLERNQTKEIEGFKIVANARINKKVDPDLVQEIAHEHGLEAHLNNLFRWKAEINAKAWSKSDPLITGAFEKAVNKEIGRPSFKIEEMK